MGRGIRVGWTGRFAPRPPHPVAAQLPCVHPMMITRSQLPSSPSTPSSSTRSSPIPTAVRPLHAAPAIPAGLLNGRVHVLAFHGVRRPAGDQNGLGLLAARRPVLRIKRHGLRVKPASGESLQGALDARRRALALPVVGGNAGHDRVDVAELGFTLAERPEECWVCAAEALALRDTEDLGPHATVAIEVVGIFLLRWNELIADFLFRHLVGGNGLR